MGAFGEYIRSLREQANKSMRAMAEAVGVSVVYISDIERGRRNPPQGEKLSKLAEFLEMDRKDLEELAAKERKRVELELSGKDSIISDAALALARRWDSITNEEASQILKIFSGDNRAILGKRPNPETIEALAEVQEMKKHPERYKGYTDVDEMMKAMTTAK